MDNGDNTNSVGVTPSLIKQLKDEFGLRASKALGQNFLTDQNICANIVALVNDGESVVEVGPGVGSLTLAIANGGHKVHCVEFDEHILEPLKFVLDKFNVDDMVTIEHNDILDVDLDTLLKSINSNTVIGNLPYNISAILLMNIAQNFEEAKNVIAMVQKEVGERFCAPLKTRGVSGVTLKSRFFMDSQICFEVPRNVFVPAPNVDSCVIKMTRRDNPYNNISKDEVKDFFKLIDAGFSMRRKMLRQSLKQILDKNVTAVLEKSGVDPTLRAEQCDLDDFTAIFKAHNDLK